MNKILFIFALYCSLISCAPQGPHKNDINLENSPIYNEYENYEDYNDFCYYEYYTGYYADCDNLDYRYYEENNYHY